MPLELGPLRERNFRLLASARTISFFGTNLAPIAVAFAVLDLTGSATDVGIAFACWTLAQVSTLLIGGVVADRLPRRLVMLSSDSANFAIRATWAPCSSADTPSIWEIFVLQALGGAATAFYSPASTGLVPETVRPALLQQANAIMSISRYLAFPVGAAVGGTIVATVGSGYALLVDAATYATSALLLSRIRLPGRARTASTPNFLRELREGWQAFTEHTWVWLLTALDLPLLPRDLRTVLRARAVHREELSGRRRRPGRSSSPVRRSEHWPVASSGSGCDRAVPWLSIGALFITTALQCALLALHAPALAIGAAAVLAGFAFSYGTVIWDTALQQTIAPEKLARVSAYNWMGAMAFLPAGYAIAGPVASVIGMSTSLWIGVVWIVVTTLIVISVRDVRDFRLEPVELPEPELAPAIAAS